MKNTLDYYVRIRAGKFSAVCRMDSIEIDCPSKLGGGIGNFSFLPLEALWTGEIHILTHTRVFVPFAHITSLETSGEYLSDESPWKLFMKCPNKFSYEYWFNLSKRIQTLVSETKEENKYV